MDSEEAAVGALEGRGLAVLSEHVQLRPPRRVNGDVGIENRRDIRRGYDVDGGERAVAGEGVTNNVESNVAICCARARRWIGEGHQLQRRFVGVRTLRTHQQDFGWTPGEGLDSEGKEREIIVDEYVAGLGVRDADRSPLDVAASRNDSDVAVHDRDRPAALLEGGNVAPSLRRGIVGIKIENRLKEVEMDRRESRVAVVGT